MIENKRFKDKLAGKVRFPEDISSKRTLNGAVFRSPVPYGRIREIILPEIPEQITVIKASDIPGSNRISVPGGTMPLLADQFVIFPGEPVVLAAGPDPEELAAFMKEIKVEIEELQRWEIPEKPEDFILSRMIVKGDPEEAMLQGSMVFDSDFSTPMQAHMATPYSSAYIRPEGQKFIISSSTQWPTNVIQNCAAVTGVPRDRFTLKLNPAGKTLDSKLWMPSVVAAQATLLAQKSKRPVRLVYSAAEDYLCSPRRIPVSWKYRAAVDDSGKLTALIISFLMDTGSSSMLTSEILDRICIGSAGIYQCRNIRVTGRAYRSNNPPLGAFSGLGLAQSFFAVESMADRIAEDFITRQKEEIRRLTADAVESGDETKLKSARSRTTIDPALWRIRNVLIKGNTYLSGGKLKKNTSIPQLMETLLKESDYTRKYAAFANALSNRNKAGALSIRRKGIGIAAAYMGSNFLRRDRGLFASTVICRLDKEGKLTVTTPYVPDNYVLLKVWKQSASRILGIAEDNVEIVGDEENRIPLAGPATLSRNVTVNTKLLEQCCEQIKKKRFRDPLPLEVKRTFNNSPSRKWDTETFTGHPFQDLSWGTCAVEVEIDEVTFSALIRKVWLSLDCGLILNGNSAVAEVESEVMQAIGWCSVENCRENSGDYTVPGIDLLPEINITFDQSSSRVPNALGGLVLNSLPAAFRNAVSQAVGKQLTSLPVRPEDIYVALEGQ